MRFDVHTIPNFDRKFKALSEKTDLEQKLSSALKEVQDSMDGKKQLMSWKEMLYELDD